MRKASREMDAAFALEVLDKAPYVTVSMIKSDGSPYGSASVFSLIIWMLSMMRLPEVSNGQQWLGSAMVH